VAADQFLLLRKTLNGQNPHPGSMLGSPNIQYALKKTGWGQKEVVYNEWLSSKFQVMQFAFVSPKPIICLCA